MRIQELISPRRVTHSLEVASKKRLLEKLSVLLGRDEPEVNAQGAFQALIERERLGSTAIGEGVALPHGRVKGLKKAVGAFATLEHEMDFDAVDHKPVTMVFALLVPEEATDEHLRILAELAGVFSQKQVRRELAQAKNAEDLYQRLTRATGV
ncbi:MAG: PTS IIA-like nitrogen-regulatory protein PtsN [Candidatus Muproteobacteria bacterium RBG_16_65_31]|uniref:PTS IIA-like nitrogen-regulatory protein PtsN n=1 Tax=Candidatus Muproteobacteria bacterium RBG_16_65_31 TaxID=1817759 RepID=A0A1F6TA84_9PROT|nr:MAG: PTS IIA-like nitrogen-regulatory protein PtsN [Candidatus Muproteobacteria bacterium RBG_16_65_31]